MAAAVGRRKSLGRNERRSLLAPGLDSPVKLSELVRTALKDALDSLDAAAVGLPTEELQAEASKYLEEAMSAAEKEGLFATACTPIAAKPNPKNAQMFQYIREYEEALAALEEEENTWKAIGSKPLLAAELPGRGDQPIYVRKRFRISDASGDVEAQTTQLDVFARQVTRIASGAEEHYAKHAKAIDAEAFRALPDVDNPKLLLREVARP
eukprot:m.113733 g.113733  ORF g.113733 m.113733 type:complete len:210 (-) comp14398_c0_seq3:124-753(-)